MTDRAATIAELERTRELTLPLFASPPAVLDRSYAPGKWTARELLLHLADHESVVLDRLRRCLSEERAQLASYDQDAWASAGQYRHRAIAPAEALYRGARGAIIDLLRLLPPGAEAATAIHPERGPLTVLQIAGTWKHNDHHLEQLQAIRDGRTWVKR